MSEHDLQYIANEVFKKSKGNSDRWNFIKTFSVLVVGFSTVLAFGIREGKLDSYMATNTKDITEIKTDIKYLLSSDHKEKVKYIKSINTKNP